MNPLLIFGVNLDEVIGKFPGLSRSSPITTKNHVRFQLLPESNNLAQAEIQK
jgi:hypothetical protein